MSGGLYIEGTRPQLPRDQVLSILDSLKADPSRFVQMSVANHLNDLGKDHPTWLMTTMKTSSHSSHAATAWIEGRYCRSYHYPAAAVSVRHRSSEYADRLGDALCPAERAQIHDGLQRQRIELVADESFKWDNLFEMKPRSTRTLYTGPHRLEVQANRQIVAEENFNLRRQQCNHSYCRIRIAIDQILNTLTTCGTNTGAETCRQQFLNIFLASVLFQVPRSLLL